MLFKYVEKAIFENQEPRSLRSLLDYYDGLLDNNNYPGRGHLSNFKTMLENHI